MTPSWRLRNGATATARKQRSITSFFSPGSKAITATPASSASPKPALVIPSPVQTTSHNTYSSLKTHPPSKPSLREPSPSPSPHGENVVGWRIRVFWPLDDQWYKGHVRSFDASTGKHLIQYDDGKEEKLDLENERFQWAEVTPLRSFRLLRRVSSGDGSCNGDSSAKRIEDEISEEGKAEGEEGGDDGDDSENENWEKDGNGKDEGGDSVERSKGGCALSKKRKNYGSGRSGSDSSVTQKKRVLMIGLKDEEKRLRFDGGEVSPREKERSDIAGCRGSTVNGIQNAPAGDVAER